MTITLNDLAAPLELRDIRRCECGNCKWWFQLLRAKWGACATQQVGPGALTTTSEKHTCPAWTEEGTDG